MDAFKDFRNSWIVLAFFSLLFCLTYFKFFPPISAVEDEMGMVGQAILWSHGKLAIKDRTLNGSYIHDLAHYKNNFVSKRNPGRSLLILPFIMLDIADYAYISSLLIHLALTAAIAYTLYLLAINPLYALLVLFHPTFSIYSRTLLADSFAGFFLVMATLSAIKIHKHKYFMSGMFIGLAALVRYHAALVLPIFCLYFLLENGRPNVKNAIQCFFPAFLIGVLIIGYNKYLYGTLLGAGAQQGFFHYDQFLNNLFYYFKALMLIWPLMFLNIFFKHKSIFKLINLVAVIFLIFFSFYYFRDRHESEMISLVIGLRLMQVALPFFILSYINVLDQIKLLRPFQFYILILLGLFLSGINYKIHERHQGHLNEFVKLKQVIIDSIDERSVIFANTGVRKMFGLPHKHNKEYRWNDYEFYEYPNIHMQTVINENPLWYLVVYFKNSNQLHRKATLQFIQNLNLIKLYEQDKMLIYRSP